MVEEGKVTDIERLLMDFSIKFSLEEALDIIEKFSNENELE